jgi:hypothetical protein
MDKKQRYATILAELDAKVKTWDDWYDLVDNLVRRAVETKMIPFVLDGMFIMAAFTRAMRELPEEGDIKNLIERTTYIIVYESKEKLGIELTLLTTEEALAQIASVVQEALQPRSRAEIAREEMNAMYDETTKKPVLH